MTDSCTLAIEGGPPIRPAGPPPWPGVWPDVEAALARVYQSGDWGRYSGNEVWALIAELQTAWNTKAVIPCASGTIAVEWALRGLGVGTGDEVLLAAYDFRGNIGDVFALGATPVLGDICPLQPVLDVAALPDEVGPKVKALLVSHMHGAVVPMPELCAWAGDRKIPVIEDACQMPGAVVHGRPAGTWGDVGVVSFGGSKLLSAGRGGALFTNRADVIQRLKIHTNRGNEIAPLSELQAAVLRPQLERLTERRECRRRAVTRLRGQLCDCGLTMVDAETESEADYYKVAFLFDPEQWPRFTRDEFATAMRAEGIALDPGFSAFHLTLSKRRFRALGELPNASAAHHRLLVLHHPVLLEDNVAIDQVAGAVAKLRRFAGQ